MSNAPYPHCNSDTLHAPGECYYCDKYPQAQQARIDRSIAFSPLEANGWSGNVAVQAGELHSHMGAAYVVGDREAQLLEGDGPCAINFVRGWRCTRNQHSAGPCALVPTWWNRSRFARRYRRSFR